ncbi:MAG: hypothetical protein WBA15_03405 [Mesorhizobium sp.]
MSGKKDPRHSAEGGAGPARILIYSNDAAFAKSAASTFAAVPHYQVLQHTLEEALFDLEGKSADLIVVDVGGGAVLGDDRLRALRAANRNTPLVVISEALPAERVREVVQLKADDWLVRPLANNALLETAASQLGGSRAMRCEIFGVIGAIGNPGATTVAIALADALNQEARPSTSELCLIDLDFASGACGAYLDVANEFDFDTIFTAPERIDLELLELICHRHSTGFDLLSVRRPDFLLSSRQDNFVLQLLDVASYRYKRIVLDLPSYPTTWTAALIAELDRLVVVTETTIPAIKSAKQRFDEAASIRQTDKGISVLANREKRRFLSRELTRSDVAEGLGRDDVDFLPEDRALITEALNRGVLPAQARASAPFNKQIKQFVRKLRGEEKT